MSLVSCFSTKPRVYSCITWQELRYWTCTITFTVQSTVDTFDFLDLLSVLYMTCICFPRVLLDQLLQYEPVSDDEEEVTDYSSSEEEAVDKKLFRAPHGKEVSFKV